MFNFHRIRLPSFAPAALCIASALVCTAPTLAHEGHDHEEAAPPVEISTPSSGRSTELSSELYEALILNHGDHVDIYLDRYDTNEPVTGAKLSVEIGEAAAVLALEEAPALYSVSITPLEPGAAVPITQASSSS